MCGRCAHADSISAIRTHAIREDADSSVGEPRFGRMRLGDGTPYAPGSSARLRLRAEEMSIRDEAGKPATRLRGETDVATVDAVDRTVNRCMSHGEERTMKTIVVGVDGSEGGMAALH